MGRPGGEPARLRRGGGILMRPPVFQIGSEERHTPRTVFSGAEPISPITPIYRHKSQDRECGARGGVGRHSLSYQPSIQIGEIGKSGLGLENKGRTGHRSPEPDRLRLATATLSTGRTCRVTPAPPHNPSPAHITTDSPHPVMPTDPRSVGRRCRVPGPSHRNDHQTTQAPILAGSRPAAPHPGGRHGAQLGHNLNPPRRPEGSRIVGVMGQTDKGRGIPKKNAELPEEGSLSPHNPNRIPRPLC